jgi:hypothetical protein
VSQDQILERKILAGTTAINKDAKQHQEEAQHRRGSISGQARQGVHDPDRLLPPFSRGKTAPAETVCADRQHGTNSRGKRQTYQRP